MFEGFSGLYAGSGLAVGIIVGLTGVGGGSLMTPLLVLLFGVHPATAVGTDLLYAGVTKGVGTGVHGWRGSIDWRIVALLGAGSVPASIATLWWLNSTGPQSAATNALISLTLGVALLITAASLVLRDRLLALAQEGVGPTPVCRAVLTVVMGVLIGVFVSISSVGAGAIGVTALFFLYPGLPSRVIVGSDIAHAVPLTLVAGAGHWVLGLVDVPMLASLLVGSIPGIVSGALCAPLLPDRALRYLLALVLVIVGGRLVLA